MQYKDTIPFTGVERIGPKSLCYVPQRPISNIEFINYINYISYNLNIHPVECVCMFRWVASLY